MQNEPQSHQQREDELVSDFDYREAPLPEGARRARIQGNKVSMEGYVLDEHFHVQDIVSGGTSQAALTGPPDYRPIPLTHICKHKQNLVLL